MTVIYLVSTDTESKAFSSFELADAYLALNYPSMSWAERDWAIDEIEFISGNSA